MNYTLTIKNGELIDAQRQQLHAIVMMMTQRTVTITEDATPTQSPPAPATDTDTNTNTNTNQVGGDHYTDMAVQPWDVMAAILTPEEYIGFLKGNIIKYGMRQGKKAGTDDAAKCQHYMDHLSDCMAQGLEGAL